LEKSIERVQQQQVSIEAVEQIEAKPLPLTSKVMMEREDYQNLVTAAQKFVVQEKKEGKLKELLKEAKKTIAELKNTIAGLKTKLNEVSQELAEYKSVRNRMYVTELEKENDWLRGKLEKYDAVIEKNDLRSFFERQKKKSLDRGSR